MPEINVSEIPKSHHEWLRSPEGQEWLEMCELAEQEDDDFIDEIVTVPPIDPPPNPKPPSRSSSL